MQAHCIDVVNKVPRHGESPKYSLKEVRGAKLMRAGTTVNAVAIGKDHMEEAVLQVELQVKEKSLSVCNTKRKSEIEYQTSIQKT